MESSRHYNPLEGCCLPPLPHRRDAPRLQDQEEATDVLFCFWLSFAHLGNTQGQWTLQSFSSFFLGLKRGRDGAMTA